MNTLRRYRCGFTLIGAFVTLSILAAIQAGAATYSFTRIADSTTSSPAGTLDVNGFGKASVSGSTVAFQACYGGAGCGIFTGGGGALTTIVQDGTAAPMGTFMSKPTPFGPESFARPPAIRGTTVAFWAGYQYNALSDDFDKSGIFSGSGGALTSIAKTGDAAPSGTFSSFLDPANSGTAIAFQGGYGIGMQGIFSSTGGPPAPIAKSGDVVPAVGTLTGFKAPSISGSNVAFAADYSGGQAIFTGSGGPLTVIAKAGDSAPVGTFDVGGLSEPTISGTTTAFRARYGMSEGAGIFRGSGGPLTTIAKTGDPAPIGTISALLFDPSISGNTVAFVGNYAAQHALFVGSGGALTPVIKKGDILFGSSVATISFEKFGLDPDGSGKLAFSYTLVNGRAGVALAAPGGLPLGDYNRNGSIDGGDYVLWRDTQGQSVAEGSGADGNYNGIIDVNDYFLWRARFGQQGVAEIGSGAVANEGIVNVPETTTGYLFVCGAAVFELFRRRFRSRRSM